jgi:hypothetical protein
MERPKSTFRTNRTSPMDFPMRISKALYVASKFKEIIGLIGFYILLAANPLSPDLQINYDKSDYVVQGIYDGGSGYGPMDSSILTINLLNNSDDAIKDIEIEIAGVVKVYAVGGRSSSVRINDDIQKYIELEEMDKYKIFLKNATYLPAGHNVKVQILGKFLDLMISDRINVTSSAKSTSITQMSSVAGLWAFAYSQSTTIFSVLSAALVLVGFNRLRKEGIFS